MQIPKSVQRVSRRDLLRQTGGLGLVATAAGLPGCMLGVAPASGESSKAGDTSRRITRGDADILRFLAAAEIIETDLWSQYCELANGNPGYNEALESMDDDMPSYICDNTNDEHSHADFLNAYLASVGVDPVNLEPFRTLAPPVVTGLAQKPRLTNLTALNVDTSWVNRYLGPGNPDFGDSFDQVVDITGRAAIPTADGLSDDEYLAAAYVAAFHFGSIEQGGTSLYVDMLLNALGRNTMKIVASIGPTEAWHLTIWRDQIGHVHALDAGGGLVFPDLSSDEDIAAHVMPNPCKFFDASLPLCSVVRPIAAENAGAVAAATFLTNSGLFTGQSKDFFDALNKLAQAADAAPRAG